MPVLQEERARREAEAFFMAHSRGRRKERSLKPKMKSIVVF